ncbi:MAG TPA: O-antigen ligase family protein [Dongiaceae bacterium]|nr:O-antigen ligase family protein [Dongiaceae bacterium]
MDRAARFARARIAAAFLVGLTIPLSVSISEIITALALALVLLERPPRAAWAAIARNPVVWASVALFLLLTLALAYTAAPMNEAFRIWQKYRELIYLPLLLLLCRDHPAARAGLAGFLLAVLAIIIANVALRVIGAFSLAPFHRYSFFGSYIVEGVLIALASYHLAIEAITNPRWRYYAAAASLVALLVALYVEVGRTGYVVTIALGLLLLFQTAPRRWIVPGIMLIAVMAGSVFVVAPDLAGRMSGVLNAVGTQAGESSTDPNFNAATSSAGARLRFYRHALEVFARHPIFGTGTGSFNTVYNDQEAIANYAMTSNPHNEFFMIGIQTGVVGVVLLLAFFATLWFYAPRLSPIDAKRGRAATLALAISCLFNSSLLDHVDGQSYIFQIALFYFAAGFREDQRPRHNL